MSSDQPSSRPRDNGLAIRLKCDDELSSCLQEVCARLGLEHPVKRADFHVLLYDNPDFDADPATLRELEISACTGPSAGLKVIPLENGKVALALQMEDAPFVKSRAALLAAGLPIDRLEGAFSAHVVLSHDWNCILDTKRLAYATEVWVIKNTNYAKFSRVCISFGGGRARDAPAAAGAPAPAAKRSRAA